MDINPFEEIRAGLRDVREGYQQKRSNMLQDEDRQIAAEQRQRMLEANNQMADSVAKYPNIWRMPVESVQAYLRGGYDAANLPRFMNEQFAPPSPFESARGTLLNKITAMYDAYNDTDATKDPQKKTAMGTQLAVLLAMDGRGQLFEKDGKATEFLRLFNPTAQNAVFQKAKDKVSEYAGELPDISVDDFLQGDTIYKSFMNDTAGMSVQDSEDYANTLNAVYSMDAKEAKKALKTGKVNIPYGVNEDGETLFYEDSIKHQSLMNLLQFKSLNDEAEAQLVKSGLVPAEIINQLKIKRAAEANNKKMVLSPSDILGKEQNDGKKRLSKAQELSEMFRSTGRTSDAAIAEVIDVSSKILDVGKNVGSELRKSLSQPTDVYGQLEEIANKRAKERKEKAAKKRKNE